MHTRSKRVSRCLFGKPDHNELEKWLRNELETLQLERVKMYGFDFKTEQPIASTASKTYVFEAVPENEVPKFYRTVYYPPKEQRKLLASPLSPPAPPTPSHTVTEFSKEKAAEIAGIDVVAHHTRSHDAVSAGTTHSATDTSNCVLPKIPKSRRTSVGTIKVAAAAAAPAAQSPRRPQRRRRGKIQQPQPLKTRRGEEGTGGVRKLSNFGGGIRKKSMKQPQLTKFLPVVRKRRTPTYATRSGCNDSPKLLDDNGSPVRMRCMGTKILNINNTGVKTRFQSRRCAAGDPSAPASTPPPKRLRSAF